MESLKNKRFKKKIDNPEFFFSQLIIYFNNIDYTTEPDFRYIIPFQFFEKIKSLNR